MININEQLLDAADCQEVYLLLQIARHMNANSFCFPSNKRLIKLTGWSKNTLKKVRDKCEAKGLIKVSERFREEGDKNKGQTSNGFTVTTDLLSVFINLNGKGAGQEPGEQAEGGGQNLVGGGGQNLVPLLSITKLNALNLYPPVVNFLNEQTGSKFKASSKKTQSLINARAAEGATIEDFQKVIAHKAAKWRNDAKMSAYLRPETLFGTKFESYLNEATRSGEKHEARHQDIGLPAEVEDKYNEYIAHVSEKYPNVTGSIAYLSKGQFATLKERKYLPRLAHIGEDTERRAFTRAHARWENGEPEATRFPGVWEYFLHTMSGIIESALNI